MCSSVLFYSTKRQREDDVRFLLRRSTHLHAFPFVSEDLTASHIENSRNVVMKTLGVFPIISFDATLVMMKNEPYRFLGWHFLNVNVNNSDFYYKIEIKLSIEPLLKSDNLRFSRFVVSRSRVKKMLSRCCPITYRETLSLDNTRFRTIECTSDCAASNHFHLYFREN